MYHLGLFMFALGTAAQSISISYSYTATVTATVIETIITCPCPTPTTTTTTAASSILLPDGTITPFVTSSSTAVSSTTSLTGVVLPDNTITPSMTTRTTTTPIVSNGISSAPVSSISTLTTSTTSTTSSTSNVPSVTNDAYINAILIHHNIHRTNHSATALTWSPSLAETAQMIAQTCVYGHVTNINGGGYGQNIGAGYPVTPLGMGNFVTEGLYNSEVNNYVYYGAEPDITTLQQWGHFTQIVWKSTTSVGCYTADCTATGLGNVGGGVPPYFTVCNYAPPGNYIGEFAPNIGVSIGLATVHADYGLSS
ncbi:hypothetical protein A1O3_03825 [Capronia epimyces CBS 606.96]|uniref:SCP domain-containing protein n=1 Tax=Capronia epimyces CBS 606.96 TaxID=1182542 RepID=W9YCC3_9EURO|nr:uncharacterized protein A1O3_03825 [Capronia epimyces CBS 606.96]EXJ86871.1 hypothetical protein A1O3_03825 [Capronia epimyces CBS 606.96]